MVSFALDLKTTLIIGIISLFIVFLLISSAEGVLSGLLDKVGDLFLR